MSLADLTQLAEAVRLGLDLVLAPVAWFVVGIRRDIRGIHDRIGAVEIGMYRDFVRKADLRPGAGD